MSRRHRHTRFRWAFRFVRPPAAAVLFATLVSLQACSEGEPTSPEPSGALLDTPVDVTLGLGEAQRVPGTALSVSFVRVAEDSRCPQDVVCVWEGNATVEVGVRAGTGPTFPLQINTSLPPTSVVWNEIRTSLVKLEPTPIAGRPIPPEEYRVTLRLEPA
ncbi:MAG: hypothetical protein ACE5GJ_10335 [Gemmatimonadota bacterium]